MESDKDTVRQCGWKATKTVCGVGPESSTDRADSGSRLFFEDMEGKWA